MIAGARVISWGMGDIKKFLLRLPCDIYEALELQAVELNTSMNKLIVERLRAPMATVPTFMRAAERTRKIAATLPNTFAGCDIPARPAHAANCNCYICKPPKC